MGFLGNIARLLPLPAAFEQATLEMNAFNHGADALRTPGPGPVPHFLHPPPQISASLGHTPVFHGWEALVAALPRVRRVHAARRQTGR